MSSGGCAGEGRGEIWVDRGSERLWAEKEMEFVKGWGCDRQSIKKMEGKSMGGG